LSKTCPPNFMPSSTYFSNIATKNNKYKPLENQQYHSPLQKKEIPLPFPTIGPLSLKILFTNYFHNNLYCLR
jgi:hypothetical protein